MNARPVVTKLSKSNGTCRRTWLSEITHQNEDIMMDSDSPSWCVRHLAAHRPDRNCDLMYILTNWLELLNTFVNHKYQICVLKIRIFAAFLLLFLHSFSRQCCYAVNLNKSKCYDSFVIATHFSCFKNRYDFTPWVDAAPGWYIIWRKTPKLIYCTYDRYWQRSISIIFISLFFQLLIEALLLFFFK